MPTFHPQAERHMKDETQDAVGSHEVGWVWGMFMKVSMGGGCFVFKLPHCQS